MFKLSRITENQAKRLRLKKLIKKPKKLKQKFLRTKKKYVIRTQRTRDSFNKGFREREERFGL